MTKQVYYRYLGTNGVIESPIHLEDIYYIRLFELIAAPGHRLTNGEKQVFRIRVPEDEVANWIEIPAKSN